MVIIQFASRVRPVRLKKRWECCYIPLKLCHPWRNRDTVFMISVKIRSLVISTHRAQKPIRTAVLWLPSKLSRSHVAPFRLSLTQKTPKIITEPIVDLCLASGQTQPPRDPYLRTAPIVKIYIISMHYYLHLANRYSPLTGFKHSIGMVLVNSIHIRTKIFEALPLCHVLLYP